MVETVQVYRVTNPDGSPGRDFTSLTDAVRYEVRLALLAAVAGMPENASADQEAIVDALLADPERFCKLLVKLVPPLTEVALAALDAALIPLEDEVVARAVALSAPQSARPPVVARPASPQIPRGGSRGPGYKVRELKEGELPKGAAFGDGDDA